MLSAHEENRSKTSVGGKVTDPSRRRRREIDRHNGDNGDFHEYADRFPGERDHEKNRHHPSGRRGRGRGGGFRQLQPPYSPPNLPPGQFPNGPRHAFAGNYPYNVGYMGYSRWGAAAGHWSTPQEDAFGYGLEANERSFGEGPYGDVAGRYGFCHPPDDRPCFEQQREITGKILIMVFPRLRPTPFSRG